MNGLLLVDLQNDFMPGGALAVEDGFATVAIANEVSKRFDIVIASRDWHPVDHGSFVTAHPGKNVGDLTELSGLTQVVWPVHCVQNTPGAEFHVNLEISNLTDVVSKGTDADIDSYSAFFDNGHRKATGLEDLLRSQGVDRIFVLGLATDYCVKYTAIDACDLGFETFVVEEGCRAVNLNPGDSDAAFQEMMSAGITIVQSGSVVGDAR